MSTIAETWPKCSVKLPGVSRPVLAYRDPQHEPQKVSEARMKRTRTLYSHLSKDARRARWPSGLWVAVLIPNLDTTKKGKAKANPADAWAGHRMVPLAWVQE